MAQRGRQQQQTVGDAVDTLPPAAHSHHRHQAAAQQTGLTLSRSHAAAMLDIVSRPVIGFMTLGLVVRSGNPGLPSLDRRDCREVESWRRSAAAYTRWGGAGGGPVLASQT